MATRTIARMFDSSADATAAVRDLEAAGFQHDSVSLIAQGAGTGTGTGSTTGTEISHATDGDTGSGAGTGATLGTLVGGGAGLLAGIGVLAIPGLGPVVAAGWLVAALTGAGLGEEESHVSAEGIRRGGSLVTVRADEARVAEAEAILVRHNAVDTDARAAGWRETGWNRFDETAQPMSGIGLAAGVGTTTAAAQMGTRTDGATRTDAAIGGGAPDGTPGNPPGTMLSRGVDDALGTNISGARPENEARHGAGAGAGTPSTRTTDDTVRTGSGSAEAAGATGSRAPGSASGDIRPERPPRT